MNINRLYWPVFQKLSSHISFSRAYSLNRFLYRKSCVHQSRPPLPIILFSHIDTVGVVWQWNSTHPAACYGSQNNCPGLHSAQLKLASLSSCSMVQKRIYSTEQRPGCKTGCKTIYTMKHSAVSTIIL